MSLIDRVRQFIADHGLLGPDTRVVAALSGGSDSVALTSILRELHERHELCLAGLAHFNHQLRPTADRDERMAASVAAALAVPLLVDREDVAARARDERRSIEDAARAARYAFFERARLHFRADVVALGHTRDDQAETVLLRLIRGAGPRGLAAMYPRKDRVVRPLLDCRRDELRAWLATRMSQGDRAADYVDDESNADVTIPRNRVRAELMPLLEERFNPNIVDVLADEAEMARETWLWLQRVADEAAAQIVIPENDADDEHRIRSIDLEALHRLLLPIRRTVVWKVMNEVARGRAVSFAHVTSALRVAEPDGPTALDGPGQRVERIGSRLVLTGRPPDAVGRWNPDSLASSGSGAHRESPANLFWYPLSIPGEVLLRQVSCVMSAHAAGEREREAIGPRAVVGNGPVAAVRGDLCGESLAVRNRRPGDRFRPVGMQGTKKLQDFFVDRKVARQERDAVPLVVDGSDRIVWVAGYGIDEAFRVTDPAQHVLILRLTQVGGGSA
jgi:tRNA(Ile)-lysidine synthase